MAFVLLFTSCDVFFDGVVSLSLISHGTLKAFCIRHHHNWISLAYLLARIFLETQLLWITPGLVGHAALLRRQGSSAEQDPWLADRTSLPWCFVGHWYPDHQVTDHICLLLASASSFHLPRQTIEVQKVVFEELLLVVQADNTLPSCCEEYLRSPSQIPYPLHTPDVVDRLGTSTTIDSIICWHLIGCRPPHRLLDCTASGFLTFRTPPSRPWVHNRFN